MLIMVTVTFVAVLMGLERKASVWDCWVGIIWASKDRDRLIRMCLIKGAEV